MALPNGCCGYPPSAGDRKHNSSEAGIKQMPTDQPVERKHVVDTHRHPFGPRLVARMAERGFFDPNKSFPQAGAGDVMYYREFLDLAYAMPKQREGGVTLSLASLDFHAPKFTSRCVDCPTDEPASRSSVSRY
jgi:hypothetical protein